MHKKQNHLLLHTLAMAKLTIIKFFDDIAVAALLWPAPRVWHFVMYVFLCEHL